MIVECNTVTEIVKGQGAGEVGQPPAVEVDQNLKLPSYIPPTAPKLAFYSDYFALARLVRDFLGTLEGQPRLAWDNHIFTSHQASFAFKDLDKRLFGDPDEAVLLDAARDHYVDKGLVGQFAAMRGAIPKEAVALLNHSIGGDLTRYKRDHLPFAVQGEHGLKSQSQKYLDSAFAVLTKHNKDSDEVATWQSYLSPLLNCTIGLIVHCHRQYREKHQFNPRWYAVLKDISLMHHESILLEIRKAYAADALHKLRELPNGETLLYLAGLGPKPKELDLTGLSFAWLTVEAPASGKASATAKGVKSRRAYRCRCACGELLPKVLASDILRGRATSCGKCHRPKTLLPPTIARRATATLHNAKANKADRASRHNYLFDSPESVLYFCGVQPAENFDLGRWCDGHTPYAPGVTAWQPKQENRGDVKGKALHTFGKENQPLLFESKLPALQKQPDSPPAPLIKSGPDTLEILDDLL